MSKRGVVLNHDDDGVAVPPTPKRTIFRELLLEELPRQAAASEHIWRKELAKVVGEPIAEIAEIGVDRPGMFQLDDRTMVRWSGAQWQVQCFDEEGKETVRWVPFSNLIELSDLIG